ncbi:NADH dehydrogenase subunit E [Citrobacter amalonaticus]|nr:NADH dehydrogenase subunit E [Citrobacter amalonaticus]
MHENQQPQTEAFELSAAEREAIEHEKHHYEDPRAASIEALKIVQKQRGWVPDGAIHAIADVLGIPASDVEGVATFYSQIFRQPVGSPRDPLLRQRGCAISTVTRGFRLRWRKSSTSSRGRRPSTVALRCCRPVALGTATKGRT